MGDADGGGGSGGGGVESFKHTRLLLWFDGVSPRLIGARASQPASPAPNDFSVSKGDRWINSVPWTRWIQV